MINDNALNEVAVNSWSLPWIAVQWDLTINWVDLCTENIKATNIFDNANINLNAYDNPQSNWRGFLSNFKRWRTIAMTVYIKWATVSEFVSNLDLFRKICFTKNINLDWKRDWVIRRIVVNCTSDPQNFNHYNITFLKMDVTFESLEPFWYKLQNQTTSIFWQTASFQEEVTNKWTAESELVTYILFNSTDSTEIKMDIWENEIVVNWTFEAWDIIQINWITKRVYLNWISVDYSWIFPFMQSWSNLIWFNIDWTFNCDIIILNRQNYV